jgi:hypothetical protein
VVGMNTDIFAAVRACSEALLAGAVLQIDGVTAGNGSVIDWRAVKSGETMQEGCDAFDTAQLFVAIVGTVAALETVIAPAEAPTITAFCETANGGRRRSFEFEGFKIMVEPHEDDAAQAAFTARLASLLAVSR